MSLTHLSPYSTISYQIHRPLFNTGASHLPPLQAPPPALPFNQSKPSDVFLPVSPNQPLGVGALAPDFVLPNQNGQPVRLYHELSRGPVVLFFYPKDGSYLCTRQVQAFRDAYPYFQQRGAAVFGISSDDAKSHQQFIAEQRLPFPLLSDPTQHVRSQYGAQSLGGVMPGRVTVVIDPATRRIRASYASSPLSPFNLGEHLRTALQALQPPAPPYPNAFQTGF